MVRRRLLPFAERGDFSCVKRILIIGIGAGDPDQLTLQAVKALDRADVFFVLDKGEDKEELSSCARRSCDGYVRGPYRVVGAGTPSGTGPPPPTPPPSRTGGARRADVYERLIADELGDDEIGAFLVWGDPSLYDSTLGDPGRDPGAGRRSPSTTR